MSLATSLRQTLQVPLDSQLDVLSFPPSADCFYHCIHALLSHADDKLYFHTLPPLFQRIGTEPVPPPPRAPTLRKYVADHLSLEQLELYRTNAMLGDDDYLWMVSKDAPKNLKQLQQFATRTGQEEVGPEKCLFVDDFALRTISDGLHLTLMIVDDIVPQSTVGMKRKRRKEDEKKQTFFSIGNYQYAVILHRSHRNCYSAIVLDHTHVWNLEKFRQRSLWPTVTGKTTNDEQILPLLKHSHYNERLPPLDRIEENFKHSHNHPVTSVTNAKLYPIHSIGKFYCGCAGFSNSNWVGNFFPKSIVGHNSDRQLKYYQQHFSTVEINSTFYGIPSQSTVLKWKSILSKTFQLVLKAPRDVTHEHEKLNISTLVYFLNQMQPLKEVLACILLQCPRTLIVPVSQLEQMKLEISERATWYTGHLAFEFRNESTFYNSHVREFMKQNRWALVLHPNSLNRSTVGTSQMGRGHSDLVQYEPEGLHKLATFGLSSSISDIVYVRLHGTNDEHRGEYSIHQLRDIACQIQDWRSQGLNVYCFFLNDLEPSASASPEKDRKPWEKWAAMPKNAKQLESIVFSLSNEAVPDAPKKPATLLRFFQKKENK